MCAKIALVNLVLVVRVELDYCLLINRKICLRLAILNELVIEEHKRRCKIWVFEEAYNFRTRYLVD